MFFGISSACSCFSFIGFAFCCCGIPGFAVKPPWFIGFYFYCCVCFKAVAELSFSGLLYQLLLMAALFPFKRLISNKSPKLTPTRTDFTSEAAAAQLSSPLGVLTNTLLEMNMGCSYSYCKILAVFITICFVSVVQAHAFIGLPPFTAYSIGTVVIFWWFFALSFYCSVMFQGWYMNKRLGIAFKESKDQAFRVKIYFLIYALPILILSDLLGLSALDIIDKLRLPYSIQKNIGFRGTAYFILGMAFIISVASIVEAFLLSKKWKEVTAIRLRSTILIANIVIFSFAFGSMVLLLAVMK